LISAQKFAKKTNFLRIITYSLMGDMDLYKKYTMKELLRILAKLRIQVH